MRPFRPECFFLLRRFRTGTNSGLTPHDADSHWQPPLHHELNGIPLRHYAGHGLVRESGFPDARAGTLIITCGSDVDDRRIWNRELSDTAKELYFERGVRLLHVVFPKHAAMLRNASSTEAEGSSPESESEEDQRQEAAC